MGYQSTEIHEEYWIGGKGIKLNGSNKSFRVDVVGINSDKSVAIECGRTPGEKIAALKMFFDEVIVLPFFTTNISMLEHERVIRLQSEEIASLRQAKYDLELQSRERESLRITLRELFQNVLEIFARMNNEYRSVYYQFLYDKEDITLINDIRRKLDNIQERIEA